MKVICVLLLVAGGLTETAFAIKEQTQDRTITRVVKMLQGMLDKSKADGDEERTIYAKFKCYCDTQTEEKTKEIADLTSQIELLKSDIDRLKGENGEDSTKCAELKSDIADNEAGRAEAEALRNKEHEDYLAAKEDMEGAIQQMKDAIQTLTDVGADQTLSTGADHTKFMAGYTDAALLGLKAKVKEALVAASAFLPAEQQQPIQSFIQAPFTGNYASQSGQVVGIVKNMLDTFEENLASAIATEKAQVESHEAYMKEMSESFKKMSDSYDDKQEKMGAADSGLSDAKEQLAAAEEQQASDEEFMAMLTPMCEKKTKEYEARKLLRSNEEAALSEAIAILNSDAAFATFGKVSATSTGATEASFIQLSSRHSTIHSHNIEVAKQILRKVKGSKKVAKVMALLDAENPFTVVLDEIDDMIKLIAEEGKADKENLDWCNSERESQNGALQDTTGEILTLKGEIANLKQTVEDPETGLKSQITTDETTLEENSQSQTSMTETRKEENMAYQANIKHLVAAEELLKGAISVLKKFYAKIDAAGFLQTTKEEPAPPDTWDSTYSGQSKEGNSAISMLEFILSESEKEEAQAHHDENDAQMTYEDAMINLKEEEASTMKNLATLQETLAATEKELSEKQEEMKKAEEQEASIEKYLLEIKPGCDFITENFDLRESNRLTEKTALENAKTLLMESPAYETAVAEAHQDSLGECKSKCEDEEHVVCKACLAKVTIPGYCAGHPDTQGCDDGTASAAAAA